MKNILKIISISLLVFFTNLMCVNAASANISVSSSSNAVVIGNTITVTITISSGVSLGSWEWAIDYNSNVLQYVSGEQGVVGVSAGPNVTSQSYTYKFKAIASGSANVGIKSYRAIDWNRGELTINAGSKTIKVISQAELEASYSKDNALKDLTINGTTLEPGFNKDTKEYTAKVNSSVEKVTINATPNDSKASVSGTGEFEVSEGNNKFEIIITAENGSKNSYFVTVFVEDPNPVTVKTTDGKTLTVVKRKSSLTKLDTFTEKSIVIKEVEVPTLYSEITKLTLVGLKDKDSKISLYVYNKDKNTYTLYREIKFNTLTVYPLDLKKENKFSNYIIKKTKINNEEVETYKLTSNSNFSIFYGTNIENNKTGYYMHDSKNNSIIEYNDEEILLLNEKLFNYKNIIVILIGESVILLMIILFVSTRKKKKIKRLVEELKHNKDITPLNISEEKIESKKEKRKKAKQEEKIETEEPVTAQEPELKDKKKRGRKSIDKQLDEL